MKNTLKSLFKSGPKVFEVVMVKPSPDNISPPVQSSPSLEFNYLVDVLEQLHDFDGNDRYLGTKDLEVGKVYFLRRSFINGLIYSEWKGEDTKDPTVNRELLHYKITDRNSLDRIVTHGFQFFIKPVGNTGPGSNKIVYELYLI